MRTDRPTVVQDGPDVLLAVQVHPRASRNQLLEQPPECFTLRLTAPPVEGAANTACCTFVAGLLGMAKSRVVLARGETSRQKLLRIRDANASRVLARLQSLTDPQK
ncbi:MAG TPA: DUF167 domain-containing protein [Candidatus Methylomirabilis sp.]|nr:DUF167 domain-containing protein [Candidatus Methylomirabilis sp.]